MRILSLDSLKFILAVIGLDISMTGIAGCPQTMELVALVCYPSTRLLLQTK